MVVLNITDQSVLADARGDRIPKEGTLCDSEIDHMLLSPRMCHRDLDVSMLVSPLPVEADITHTGKINAANSCVCHNKEYCCIVGSVHGFDMIHHVHSSR